MALFGANNVNRSGNKKEKKRKSIEAQLEVPFI
jgi:hypothetical protein